MRQAPQERNHNTNDGVPMATKKTTEKASPKRASAKPKARKASAAKAPVLTHDDALALAEAFVEAVNEGATDPVVFMVNGDDPLGRMILEAKLGESEGMVPLVLDAPVVRRYAMLLVADELLWRNRAD